MLYRDLIQFEPIETIIQLREADREDAARELVQSYVVSDRMADQLINLVIPQIQFLTPADNKGVLVVGNYGTGKSHLMSVISAVAQYPELASAITHTAVAEAATTIAGRFKVVRTEVGASERSLRDSLLDELQGALEGWGVPFSFPRADQITNNKDSIVAAVAAFQERYPEQGILLVVDELLDFLRTREERALILDLGFLRELGEVVALTPFRFLGGLQESLFDSPRFAFVADQLHRVRDRFEQARIAREDIAYVVSHRLLRKTDAQLARITEHLHRFTHLYPLLGERLQEYALLFPIHPAYIETFERVYVAEKREVLKTFSLAMRDLLDQKVPADQPGLISYDHYWAAVRDNAGMRSLPGVSTVVEKSAVLEDRISNGYTRPQLLPMARRIVHALSVQRLTTGDINAPLGPTAEELRDGLCLHTRMPEDSPEFLLDQVQVALREILRTVSGQYMSRNDANGQYYLDVRKDVDFDALIRQRGDFIQESDLNRYFFDALRLLLNLPDTTYMPTHRIWFYELPWTERGVNRPGYLFFGAPDERGTAHPPRDFYVYFLPPFADESWNDQEQPDEVILQLTGMDPLFEDAVRLYGGALLQADAMPQHRQHFLDKADAYRDRLTRWIRSNLAARLQVRHQGVCQSAGAALAGSRATATQGIDELVRQIASRLLEPCFNERYPDYPAFTRLSQPVSEAARATDAQEAIRHLAGRPRTALATAVLDGLELLDEQGNVRPARSRYARRYLELLLAKPEGQVVNRGELMEQLWGGLTPVEKDIPFHLEPEWAAVLLVSLVYSGDLVLETAGRESLSAERLERAASMPLAEITNFRHYARPRTMPVGVWVEIFELLGLTPGRVRDENTREDAVRELDRAVQAEILRTLEMEGRIQQGVRLWNSPLFTDSPTYTVEAGVVVGSDQPAVTLSSLDLLPHLRGYKQFLEELARFNTPGKLRNLRIDALRVAEARGQRAATGRAAGLLALVDAAQPFSTYLAEAQASLPTGHPWSQKAASARAGLLDRVRRFGRGEGEASAHAVASELEALKREYVAAYSELHRSMVLGPSADDRRQRIYRDRRLATLEELSTIELMSGSELEALKGRLASLPTCREFHEGVLADSPVCPHCRLRPSQRPEGFQAEAMLNSLDAGLDVLLRRWRQALAANLASESARGSLEAMAPDERRPVELFLAQPEGDNELPPGFVAAASQALRGIQSVSISATGLMDALKYGGLPCTVPEMQRRFAGFMSAALRGHDSHATRLTLEE